MEKPEGEIPLQATFDLEKRWLIATRNNVRKRAEAAYKTEKANDAVWEWLNDAEKLIQEINIATRDTSKQHGEMINKIKMLKDECKLERFFSPIPDLGYFSSESLVCFKSTEKASHELLEALKSDSIYVIALYGDKGSGKTELVKAVGEKAKYLKFFDAIIFATVSQNPLRKIQEQIAQSLNVKFDKHSELGRARKIYSTLSESKDQILVILDDVKEKLDPEDIGIPCQSNQCKVLLTTRHKQECASNCQRVIPLRPLLEEEAWGLLAGHSGIDDDSPYKLTLAASEIVGACKMFPGLIKDIGPSLKNKPIEEWDATVSSLRNSKARYQIFISFRGEDTRESFTGFLYEALCREGFKTFLDDGGLKGGDQISETLVEAIEDSRLSIVVFSENYAESRWCLEELVTIVECKKYKKQLVWPIFYKVSRSDVRLQKNSYGKAMAKHEERFQKDPEKVQKWRSVLSEVAKLKTGMQYSTGYEYKFIERIVEAANNVRNRLYIRSMGMD
ncbi:uncharacterized protein LOC130733140 [Lotus japonicus]|uniref:uncharacterized protein LOC130733140 n=1 Tax=Lotus japonicus TaxID=34305 RepID=UPI00258BD2B0|nr:uncharacterized protein LOC130733140 [Lotus japonicus]XP_057441214.1 uncharacterized protein LOC130733140 [Lotus japonicus]XP_057441215.1 uncharacterized protein LOC130733140 [Lotus japonicus]XP_057441216.1 uncharacterized protein LOC130733140 [Lotus japonicus]